MDPEANISSGKILLLIFELQLRFTTWKLRKLLAIFIKFQLSLKTNQRGPFYHRQSKKDGFETQCLRKNTTITEDHGFRVILNNVENK